jgi:dihydroxyacetone kinase-like predicted kinase
MCAEGDALGLLDGRVVVVGVDLERVARDLLDRLAPGSEIVTVVLGGGAPEGAGDRLRAYVEGRQPGVEVVVVDGGSDRVPVLLGAE